MVLKYIDKIIIRLKVIKNKEDFFNYLFFLVISLNCIFKSSFLF